MTSPKTSLRRLAIALGAACALVAPVATSAWAEQGGLDLLPKAAPAIADELSYVPGEAIVILDEPAAEEISLELEATQLIEPTEALEPDDPTETTEATEPIGEVTEAIESFDVDSVEAIDDDALIVELADEDDTEAFIATMDAQEGVSAQPNYRYSLLDEDLAPTATGTFWTDDPYGDLQYYLGPLGNGSSDSGANVVGAWNALKGEPLSSVTVAVLDTGAQTTHEDLRGVLDTQHMRDVTKDSGGSMVDLMGHGTHVAGIIGAVANNDLGIAGVASGAGGGVKVLPVKVFTDGGDATTATLVKGLRYVAELKEKGTVSDLRIVNMSVGYYNEQCDNAMATAIDDLLARGVVAICSGGNGDDRHNPRTDAIWPSDLEAVISVTSLDEKGANSSYSDYNLAKDISAPGDGIVSTYIDLSAREMAEYGYYGNDVYYSLSGTSMAAPVVSGVAAMLCQVNPDISAAEIRSALLDTARTLPSSTNDHGAQTGSKGALDAEAAVRKMLAGRKSIETATIEDITEQTYTGSPLTPNPKVTLESQVLIEGRDYRLSYSANVAVGQATVTATGCGRYQGSVSATFQIAPASVTVLTVTPPPNQTYTGKALTPVPTVRHGSRTLSLGNDYTLDYASNTALGQATVTIKGAGNYTGETTTTFQIVRPAQVGYRVHVQNTGWQGSAANGALAGTTGRALRLEGIRIERPSMGYAGSITYRTHVQNIGWQSPVSDGALAGTTGRGLRLEAVEISLSGELGRLYDVWYRVHAQDVGWMGWAKDGQRAGTAGYGRRLEALEIELRPKGQAAPGTTKDAYLHPLVEYRAHVQNLGWQGYAADGALAGTTGRGLRLEAVNLRLSNQDFAGSITYRTHVQNLGWQGMVRDGAQAGSTGRGLRLEAIQIDLTGEMAAHYDVWYRVHAQNLGWMGWASNGDRAGTAGYGWRLEGLEVRLLPKGSAPPRSTSLAFRQK